MNAHKFVAEHGIDEAKRVLEGVSDQCKIINISCGEYFEEPCECCKANEVLISELKQVVESVEIVDSYGGITKAKAYMTRYFKLNGAFRKDYPKTGKFITKQMSDLDKAIADYELVESHKENQNV